MGGSWLGSEPSIPVWQNEPNFWRRRAVTGHDLDWSQRKRQLTSKFCGHCAKCYLLAQKAQNWCRFASRDRLSKN
jgi:hypothetical protein